jgi:hypothetical protein
LGFGRGLQSGSRGEIPNALAKMPDIEFLSIQRPGRVGEGASALRKDPCLRD